METTKQAAELRNLPGRRRKAKRERLRGRKYQQKMTTNFDGSEFTLLTN